MNTVGRNVKNSTYAFKLMVAFLLLLLSAFSAVTAKPAMSQYPYDVNFKVKTTNVEDIEIFKDGIIPWVSIENPSADLDRLINKDEVVIYADKAILLIDYPLNTPVQIPITAKSTDGFTRSELAEVIGREYMRIYREEEQSATIKTVPLKERKGLINRNQTNGKYGIWGHDISDLDLSGITVSMTEDGEVLIELGVES